MSDTQATGARTKTIWMMGHRATLIPCGERYFALDITTPAGVPGPPPHFHEDSEEMFHVLGGSLEVRSGDQWLRLEAGESLTVPRGGVHTFRNPTDTDVRWLTGWNPLGFQEWFGLYGVDALEPDARDRSVSEEVIGRAVEACAGFGMVIVDG